MCVNKEHSFHHSVITTRHHNTSWTVKGHLLNSGEKTGKLGIVTVDESKLGIVTVDETKLGIVTVLNLPIS